MTDVLSAEDIKKAVGAFSGECLIFFLSFLFFFSPPFRLSSPGCSAFI